MSRLGIATGPPDFAGRMRPADNLGRQRDHRVVVEDYSFARTLPCMR
jgi:hypothetical protein